MFGRSEGTPPVLAAERKARILGITQERGAVRVVDLVAELGVSDATVRRDLESLAEDGLVDKVHGGATVASSAGSSAISTTVTVGVVAPRVDYYYRHVVDGIRRIADRPGAQFTVNLVLSNGFAESERALISGLVDSGVSGLLLVPALWPDEGDGEYARWIRRLPVPTVLIERELTGRHVGPPSSVRTAHDQGAAVAVEYLYQLGHRQIALITRADTQSSMLVRAGWEGAMSQLGVSPLPSVITGKTERDWNGWKPAEMDAILAEFCAASVTAVLCHNDEDALTLVQHAQQSGWTIPEDLSVIAYDDELASVANPPLTAVSPPRGEIGAIAASTLLSLIEEGSGASARKIRVDPSLIVRRSTTIPKSGDLDR